MRDIIKEIGLDEYKENIKNVDNKEEYETAYLEKVYEFLKKEDISVCVVVLDLLFNYNPEWSYNLLSKKDEKLLRAQLVLEMLLIGTSGIFIKDYLESMKEYNKVRLSSSKDTSNLENTINISNKILSLLNEYLKEKTDEAIFEMEEEDLITFSKGLNTLHENIFINERIYIDSRFLISNLFNYFSDNFEMQNYIYKEILLKNRYLESSDCSIIIKNNIDWLINIDGLYKKSNDKVYDWIVSLLINRKTSKHTYDILNQLYQINKNDKFSITIFFNEIRKRLNSFQKYRFERKKFSKELKNVNLENLLQENLEKILTDSSDIDEAVLEELGRYSGFLKHYDNLLEKFVNSNDINYKKILVKPLLVGLIVKLKEIYNLNFKYLFENFMNDNSLGGYTQELNLLYINPFYLANIDSRNLEETFVSIINTIFHEVRHVIQFREIETSKKINYQNLIMSIDKILRELDNSYYKRNYTFISYEYDAREKAYVDTMKFFNEFPNFQKMFQEYARTESAGIIGKYVLSVSDNVRIDSKNKLVGIINLFIESINSFLNVKTDNDNDIEQLEEFKYKRLTEIAVELKKYPVIEFFFDVDINNRKIAVKNEEYFKNKYEELKSMPDSSEKKERMLSIKQFFTALKYGEAYEKKNIYLNKSEIDEEVTINVGEEPSR